MNEEHIDFSTIKEDFSQYEAENGQILKIKKSIMDIIREKDEDGKLRSGLKIKDITHVVTTKFIDTKDMEEKPLEEISEKDEKESMKFKPKKQVVNIYETEKSIILVGVKVIKIFNTDKIDQTGTPYLRYRSETAVSVIEKSNLFEPPKQENP